MPGIRHIEAREGGYGDVLPGEFRPVGGIMHVAQGYMTTIDDWARDDDALDAMPHFGVDRDGRARQYVSVRVPAWHAGRLDTQAGPDGYPTWSLLPRSAAGWTNPNKVALGFEAEGFSAEPDYGFDYIYDDENPWPSAMVGGLIAVIRWAFAYHGIEVRPETIAGHNETAPISRKNDPGRAWPKILMLVELADNTEQPPDSLHNEHAAALASVTAKHDELARVITSTRIGLEETAERLLAVAQALRMKETP